VRVIKHLKIAELDNAKDENKPRCREAIQGHCIGEIQARTIASPSYPDKKAYQA
jgi:hypothetical protein